MIYHRVTHICLQFRHCRLSISSPSSVAAAQSPTLPLALLISREPYAVTIGRWAMPCKHLIRHTSLLLMALRYFQSLPLSGTETAGLPVASASSAQVAMLTRREQWAALQVSACDEMFLSTVMRTPLEVDALLPRLH
jgi:hypothetical protein